MPVPSFPPILQLDFCVIIHASHMPRMYGMQVAGDGQELGALEAWYAREGGRTAESPLLIGSVKSNMGHCEGCSGLAGAHVESMFIDAVPAHLQACSQRCLFLCRPDKGAAVLRAWHPTGQPPLHRTQSQQPGAD